MAIYLYLAFIPQRYSTLLRTALAYAGTPILNSRIDYSKNFAFVDEVTGVAPGINGKMSDLSAAFSLLQLKYVDTALARRKEIYYAYRVGLKNVKSITCWNGEEDATTNHFYFPILIQSDYPINRDELYQKLKDRKIYARRYFYTLISDFPMYRSMPSARRSNLPIASQAAEQVLCLPIYPAMNTEDQQRIIDIILEVRS